MVQLLDNYHNVLIENKALKEELEQEKKRGDTYRNRALVVARQARDMRLFYRVMRINFVAWLATALTLTQVLYSEVCARKAEPSGR